ncbi:MAG: hypothetical protein ACRD16_11575 [Thermoanaerobaculia bacterium]
MIAVLLFTFLLALTGTAPAANSAAPAQRSDPAASTYLFEWTTRTGAALRRLTLFSDGILVRKTTSSDAKVEFKKRKLSQAEYDFYAKYFGSPESQAAGGSYETGLVGDETALSVVSFAPPDAPKWSFSFDSLSAFSAPAARVKSALDGLLDSFGKVLPNEDDFPMAKLLPGTILRRRDGQEFRIVHVDENAKIVEARAVGQPYSQFFPWAKLRFSFLPP